MKQINPSSAYSFLTDIEREVVDKYVQSALEQARRKNFQIRHLVDLPIPQDAVKRSKGVLEKPLVVAAIHDELKRVSSEKDLAPERVIKEHLNIGLSNIADYLVLDEDTGYMKVDVSRCTREQMAAVKRIRTTSGYSGFKVELELYDKQHHLVQLGKMMGLEEEKNEVFKKFMDKPEQLKSLPKQTTTEEVEKIYSNLLESI